MFRRCRAAFGPIVGSQPVFEALMHAQPEGSALWGTEAALLHRHQVRTLQCWADLAGTGKAELIGAGLPADVAKSLDLLVAERSGQAIKSSTPSRGRLIIGYGSQTGTSESYARMLATFAGSHGYVPVVVTLNDAVAVLKGLSEKPAAFVAVCSTYGTGEFPSNAGTFYEELAAGHLHTNLKDTPVAVFGLGNSHNDHFNAAAKSITKALKKAGASSLLRTVLSCELEPTGHDAAFRNWKRQLWASLGEKSGATADQAANSYVVTPIVGRTTCEDLVRPNFHGAMVHKNQVLTPTGYKPRARVLTFQVPMRQQKEMLSDRRAVITDQVLVQPQNCSSVVERALKVLGHKAGTVVEVAPLPSAAPSWFDGHKMTASQLLRDVIDLQAIPSRSLLEVFATLVTDPIDAAKIEDLANDLSANSEYEKLTSGSFSILDCLDMFHSLRPTLAQLLSHAPHIAPRTYSLAADNSAWKNDEFEIVYNVPQREMGGRSHEGLATSTLERMNAGDKFLMQFAPGPATLPQTTSPTVYVALGTGIGLVRAALQQRRLAAKAAPGSVPMAVVYYGFRKTTVDQLFKEELEEMQAEGLIDVRYVPSNDGEGFVTPMDKFDESVASFLGRTGEVLYCGPGGSVPLLCDTALRRVGVDVPAMRAAGRYHEEYFTADPDAENLLKQAHAAAGTGGATLASRMGNCEMFCFQCEQTFKGKGCFKTGVCGKTPRVAALQDLTVHQAKVLGFYCHELRKCGGHVPDSINRLTLYSLFATLTNVNFDENRFVTVLRELQKATTKMRGAVEAAKTDGAALMQPPGMLPATLPSTDSLVELGRGVSVLSRFGDANTQSAAGVGEMLMYGLKGVAAYTDHSLMNGMENDEVYQFMHEALAWVISPQQFDLGRGLELCLQAGKINITSMGMLYESNKTLGVPTPTPAPMKPVAGKAILVSGHDLIILKGLLEVCEPLGIKVYTHGEMLPAHGYPVLKKFKSLAGHYGGAWMRQSVEFPHFPGPVLMTTNCLSEPHVSYKDRLFTAGAVGWKGVPHIGDNMDSIKFDGVIAAAQATQGFSESDKEFRYPDPVGQHRPAQLTVGFGHETILSVAPTILEEIQKGNITRFFVVGGCDGYEGERSYYTDLVAKMPKTAVVLTLGCGKFRLNHLDLGTIGETGIPRILDMGQCNDSYGAVQVALALADALKCEVKDLPLSIVLSWFEQKAVAVLLSLLSLGIKPIHIGPSLPAFLTPEVAAVLVKDFGIVPCGDAEADLKAMCAATGAS